MQNSGMRGTLEDGGARGRLVGLKGGYWCGHGIRSRTTRGTATWDKCPATVNRHATLHLLELQSSLQPLQHLHQRGEGGNLGDPVRQDAMCAKSYQDTEEEPFLEKGVDSTRP